MTLRIRKWQSAGPEVTITLTRAPNGVDVMLLHEAIHAFSRSLSGADLGAIALIEQLTAERDAARQALTEIVHGRPEA